MTIYRPSISYVTDTAQEKRSNNRETRKKKTRLGSWQLYFLASLLTSSLASVSRTRLGQFLPLLPIMTSHCRGAARKVLIGFTNQATALQPLLFMRGYNPRAKAATQRKAYCAGVHDNGG